MCCTASRAGNDGGNPNSVIRDSAGNLYGTTNLAAHRARVWSSKSIPSGHETVLYTFTGGADGAYPNPA